MLFLNIFQKMSFYHYILFADISHGNSLFYYSLSEAVVWRCSVKKVLLEISLHLTIRLGNIHTNGQ